MNAAPAHELTWVAAAPLWKGLVKDRTKLRRPALLSFDSDAFMDELFAELESEPEKIATHIAKPDEGKTALKLYQPVHGQFHLVAASLVCQLPGLPDHAVDAAKDKAQFVLRRLAGDVEFAWTPPLHTGSTGEWKPVAAKESIAPGEELLPLFPGNFVEPAPGHRRRLLFGLVPTSSREVFQAAEVTEAAKVGDDGETVLKSGTSAGVLVPKLGAQAGARYVIRCVYRKPRCEPREAPLLSDPTESFAIASYFDPDAPARNIRIPLPMSLAHVLKAKKGAGVVISQELSKSLKDAVGGIFGKLKLDAPPDDVTCELPSIPSFAIPVLTLIAMILIMIILSLLMFVMPGLPPFKICLPISLKAKD